jgi:galactokinase
VTSGRWAAPGRVNLIGEHTDYNDGYVLPLALEQQAVVRAERRGGRTTTVSSRQAPGEAATFDAHTVSPGDVTGWAGYVAGVVWALRSNGYPVGNVDIEVDSDVPLGAGLSSSAALECASGLALAHLFGQRVAKTELAQICRRAENEYVGAPTGIMDQMAAMHGRDGHLVFIDTRTMAVEHVPFDLDGAGLQLLVIDTRAPHRHVDGEYAARRQACEQSARLLGVPALRDAEPEQLAALPSHLLPRARHVVTENARVLDVVDSLRSGADPREIGPSLTASHVSLRDDFEVTVPEIDVAFEALLESGAHGARITGGGFGGCVIALVDANSAQASEDAVHTAFEKNGFADPDSFPARPSDGARRLT